MSDEMDKLAKFEPVNVAARWRMATDVAGALREFVLKRTLTIQGKKYPPIETWQATANMFGCVASARDVEEVKGGIRAQGEVRLIASGLVIATGEGFVGDDEKMWQGRPMFARRAMAQTRAISRACRAAFAFIIPLIDAGLQTTPAEEMEAIEAEVVPPATGKKSAPSATAALKATLKAKAAQATPPTPGEPPPHTDDDAPAGDVIEGDLLPAPAESDAPAVAATVPWGRMKGTPISDLTTRDLGYYVQRAEAAIADPSKAAYRASETLWLSALQAELRRRK